MRFVIEKIKDNPVSLMRRAGYAFQRNEANELSFVRPLAVGGYPRFHAYVHLKVSDLSISLHLDHKKETYGDSARHHAEYDESGAVKNEAERIKSVLS